MNITNKRYLVASLAALLFAPCIIQSAAEAAEEVDPELQHVLALSQQAYEEETARYNQELERTFWRNWATTQLEDDEERKERNAAAAIPAAHEDERKEQDNIDPEVSSDEDERPEVIELRTGTRYTPERYIGYQPEVIRPRVAQLLAAARNAASAMLQQATYLSSEEAVHRAIKQDIEDFSTLPFEFYQTERRSLFDAINREISLLHDSIEQRLVVPRAEHLRNIIIREAQDNIQEAQATEHFNESTVGQMQQDLARLQRQTNVVRDIKAFKTSLTTNRKLIQETLAIGKVAAAEKSQQLKAQQQQRADFAADITGMGGLY
ncbi:MAG TPA: hypothetical protein VGT41_01390 [Candidatus Babeliales bacterium]|nr:hypothetical protein [Candidatus Babeliales bacterium]